MRIYLLLGMFFLPLLFLVGSLKVHAALLYIDPGEMELHRGETKTFAVRIDTDDGECINTVDAVIVYSETIRAVDVSRGESILSIWVEDPLIDEDAHTITFAGGIPGGYCGRIAGDPELTNIIAEIVVRSPGLSIGGTREQKQTSISFADTTQVLLHDGFGTPAALRLRGAAIQLLDSVGKTTEDDWRERVASDTIPPADFSITLSQSTTAFSNRYFIVFNTQDKQSGIDHYEVMEEPFEDFDLFAWGAAEAPWVPVESPYVLRDQTLNSTIRVKAIDKAGNETIAILVPDVAVRADSRETTLLISILVFVLLAVVGLLIFALVVRKRRLIAAYNNNNNETSDAPEE